jgi:hypothetical protein
MAQLFWLSGQQLSDGNGAPYPSAKAWFYETGNTTPKATYSDAGLTSVNANPVVADSNGRFGDIYFVAGRYKVVLTTSADVAIDTLDPVDGTSQLISVASAPATTYPFLRYHNTTDGKVYRRNAANTAWINEGAVDSLLNAASVSDVLVGTDASKSVTPDALAGLWQRGSDIASASTLTLPATGGGVFAVTGTTTVTGISSAYGGRRVSLRFAASLTLTHNGTSFILPGAVNITTAAGDVADFINDAAQDATGSNWRCVSYTRASGSPINNADFIATQADMESASSTTAIVTPGRARFHPGTAKAWLNWSLITTTTITSSHNVSSLTDTGVGITTVNWTTSFSTAGAYVFAGAVKADAAETIGGILNMRDGAPTSQMAAASMEVTTRGGGGTLYDTDLACLAAFGDQ